MENENENDITVHLYFWFYEQYSETFEVNYKTWKLYDYDTAKNWKRGGCPMEYHESKSIKNNILNMLYSENYLEYIYNADNIMYISVY